MCIRAFILVCVLTGMHTATQSHAQESFNDLLVHDTTLVSEFSLEAPDIFRAVDLHDDELWLFMMEVEDDSLVLWNVQLEQHITRKMRAALPATVEDVSRIYVKTLAANAADFVISIDHTTVLHYVQDSKSRLTLNSQLQSPFKFQELKFFDNNLLGWQVYNYHPKDAIHPRLIAKYQMDDMSLQKSIHPRFHPLALTHFSPNQWVTVGDQRIAAANAATYEITIYNRELEVEHVLQRDKPPYWQQIDTLEIVKRIKDVRPEAAKTRIERVSPLYDEASTLNYIQFLGDNILAARVRSGFLESGYPRYIWDVWRFEDGKWRLWKQDLPRVFRRHNKNVITSDSYPIISFGNMMYLNQNYLVALRYGSGAPLAGKSYEDFEQAEDDFLTEHPMRLIAEVFRWKWTLSGKD